MKLRNWITLGLVVSASTLTFACGGKDKGGDGDGDNNGGSSGDGDDVNGDGKVDLSDVQAEIDELQKQIKDLEKRLADAAGQEIPDLQDELDKALARLDELENCANGGSCDGVKKALELSAFTNSYCEWVFGCCSGDEAKATLGNAATDEDSCKTMFKQLLVRGGSSLYAPGMTINGVGSDSYSIGQLAARLQTGRIELDVKAAKACAEEQAERPCNDADPVAPLECGEGVASACTDIFKGLQTEGEPCSYGDECADGLYCSGGYAGYKDGVCLVEAKLNDLCQEEADCYSSDGELYCDESKGSCQQRAAEGDDCEFADPTFDKLPPSDLTLPCMPGYWCSLETSTCVAACDKLDEDEACSSTEQCGEDLYCDLSGADDQAYAGVCTDKLAAHASSSLPATCKSGAVYSDTTDASYDAYYCSYYGTNCAYRCTGEGGEDCSYDDFGGSDCNSGSCKKSKDECRTKCDAQYDCAKGESCVSGVCYESVTSHKDCVVTEQCPGDEFCEAGKCADRVKTGDRDNASDDCTSNEECTDGSACVYSAVNGTSDCVPFKGLGTDADCTDWFHCTSGRCELDADLVADNNKCLASSSLGNEGSDCDMKNLASGDINQDPCKSGLFCKRTAPNSTTDFDGVCTKQLQPGQACDRSLASDVKQCVGNEVCATNPATGVSACRVPYSEPGDHEKCVLGTSTFRVQVAYGDSGTYGAL